MRVDAGIARLAAGVPFSNEICMVGATEGTTDPMKKMVVVKHGRTTGLTAAPIKTVGLEALVDDPDTGRELSFVDLFLVEPDGASSQLALPGDSGSLVVDGESRKAVGLLHAADPGGTFYYAQSIKAVLKELEIDLLP